MCGFCYMMAGIENLSPLANNVGSTSLQATILHPTQEKISSQIETSTSRNYMHELPFRSQKNVSIAMQANEANNLQHILFIVP